MKPNKALTIELEGSIKIYCWDDGKLFDQIKDEYDRRQEGTVFTILQSFEGMYPVEIEFPIEKLRSIDRYCP